MTSKATFACALGLLALCSCKDPDPVAGGPWMQSPANASVTQVPGGAGPGAAPAAGTTGGMAGAAGMAAAAGMTGAAGMAGAGGMAAPAMLTPADYTEDANWLCRPGLAGDACAVELSATEVLADGTQTVTSLPLAIEAEVDCFYLYPTVDMDMVPTNKDFAEIDRELILDPLLGQAAPLRSVCNVFAPVYRQASIGSYLADPAITEQRLGLAFTDVAAAFTHYLMVLDTGKPLVIVGHSQGSMMATLLIQTVIDGDATLRGRLVAALLVGALGFYSVPEGALVGGSFENVPLCSAAEENGCVVTFNTFGDGFPPNATYGGIGAPPAAGTSVGCINPGAPTGGKAVLRGAWLPTSGRQPSSELMLSFGATPIETDFAVYRDLFAGECTPATNGNPYLKITVEPAAGDARTNPVPFASPQLSPDVLGLHLLDYAFVAEDLRSLLETKIAAR
jgi:hypothetical protein